MSDFSAAPSTLGILHQVRYALVVLLQHEDSEVRLEALDDIELSRPGTPSELLQLKHRAPDTKLTDSSKDLWKSLRIWSTLVKDQSVDLDHALLTLITTAIAPPNSAAEYLRPAAGRDVSKAFEKIRNVIAVSTN